MSRAAQTEHVEALYRDVGPAVLAYLARRTDTQRAADLFSEVLVVLWRRRADVPPPGQDRLWLFGIARNVLSTHYRQAVRHRAIADAVAQELAVAHQPTEDTEAKIDLRTALRALDDLDREIVQLSGWEQLTSVEIGSLLSMPPETVRTRLRRARRRLRDDLGLTPDPHLEPASHP